MTKLRENWMV